MNPKLIFHKFRTIYLAWIAAALWLAPGIASVAQTPPPPSAGQLQFTYTQYFCGERESLVAAGSRDLAGARLTVTRTQPAKGAVLVDYVIKDGTAKNGTNYGTASGPVPTNGTLAFLDYQMSVDLIIPVIDDATNNPSRTFTVTLQNPRAAPGEQATVLPQLGLATN